MSFINFQSVVYSSPLGKLQIKASDSGIREVLFLDEKADIPQETSGILGECIQQLDEYFTGKRKKFSVLLDPEGTDFQKSIWKILSDIPHGQTVSYLDLALKAGGKNLTRAVGTANGSNKIAIIIPCHRVIGANGDLTGYAGGLWRKKWLLNFEQKERQPELFAAASWSEISGI